jgi:hypothetical protein
MKQRVWRMDTGGVKGKDGKGAFVKVSSKIKLKIGKVSKTIRDDPPTQNFLNDVVSELLASTPTAVLKSIGAIDIIDSTGERAVRISGSALSLSASGNQVTASGSGTYGSTNPPATIRIMASDLTTVYFQTPVPSGFTAQANLPVSVTWNATITVSQGSSSGYLAGASFNGSGLQNDIASILAGQRGNIVMTLQYIDMTGRSGTQYGVVVIPKTALSRDPTNKRAYLSPTKVSTSADIMYVTVYAYYGNAYITYLAWTLNPFLTVGSNDYVSFDITFQV